VHLIKNDITFNFPRQLIDKGEKPNFCLADFISPNGDDHIGLFTVTAGHGLEKLVEQFESDHDDYNAILVKVLADRYAEAATEWLHEKIRKNDWGYGSNEIYSKEELIKEKYQGIRPAPGYPSCPDHAEKDKIWKLLDVENAIGVSLTESRAMWPAASVCGWYFSHPESQYFSVLKNN
jgi:5-methyltetrahydrofolate--homocysteine methyltransferase